MIVLHFFLSSAVVIGCNAILRGIPCQNNKPPLNAYADNLVCSIFVSLLSSMLVGSQNYQGNMPTSSNILKSRNKINCVHLEITSLIWQSTFRKIVSRFLTICLMTHLCSSVALPSQWLLEYLIPLQETKDAQQSYKWMSISWIYVIPNLWLNHHNL